MSVFIVIFVIVMLVENVFLKKYFFVILIQYITVPIPKCLIILGRLFKMFLDVPYLTCFLNITVT